MTPLRTFPSLAALLPLLLAGCLDGVTSPQSPSAGSADDAAAALPPWPDLAAAKIRPGVQVVSKTGQCTSSFLFRSPDNATLYLGLAAHCVDGLDLEAPVQIDGASKAGHIAYYSFKAMKDAKEEKNEWNDFALIRIDPEDRAVVHPAMRHFGGPVGLKPAAAVQAQDRVLTYGNSGLRQEIGALSPHEGYVVEPDAGDGWGFIMATVTPGIPGDSGSAVIGADGEALGTLITLYIFPPGLNGVSALSSDLEYASKHGAPAVELVTWTLLDDGLLPDL